MKLRTEMAKWSDGNMYPSVHGEREVYSMLEHDSAAAHALMLAIEEYRLDYPYGWAYASFGWVYKRADELMAEWGFDSGEGAGDE